MVKQLFSGLDGQRVHMQVPCFLFARCALFQVPYPATPVFATLRQTAGCLATISILELNTASALSERLRVILFSSCRSTFSFELSTVDFVSPALHYPLHFGRTACRAARTPGNCFATT